MAGLITLILCAIFFYGIGYAMGYSGKFYRRG